MSLISPVRRKTLMTALIFVFASTLSLAETRLVILGSGTPNADPDRSGPAIAVVVDDQAYLVDMGPGIVRRAAAASRQGIDALKPENLDIVFVTHLHSDHTLGFADLLFTPWTLEREKPLRIFGPEGIKAMTDHISAAYQQDVVMRLNGLEPANETGYKTEVTKISAGEIYRDDKVRVDALAVNHGSWKEAFGFRFISDDRTIVISGDTARSEAVIEACQGCDILLHEVYSDAGFERREPVWQQYHSQFHTSATEVGRIAKQSQPKKLVLYHQLLWGSTEDELIDEVRSTYDGEVLSADDLDVF